MDLARVLEILAEARKDLDGFFVAGLWLFGSFARGEASDDSDVDLLVELDRPVGLFHFVRLQRYLEERLGRRVDLVTRDALRPELKGQVEREALRAA